MYRYEWQIPLLFFLGSICTIFALYQREPYFILTASFTFNGMPALPALFSPINFTSFSLTIDLSDEEKSVCVRRHQEHLDKAKAERECYVYKPVKRLKEILRHLDRNLTSTKTETNRSLETKIHYSFGYVQQVHIPSNPMQPGPIYFKTPRKCGILGVTSEAVLRQIIILVDEGVSVGKERILQ